MTEIQIYKKFTLNYISDVKAICKILFDKTPIDYFCYLKSCADGRLLHLASHELWHEYYIDQALYKLSNFRKPSESYKGDFILCSFMQGPAIKIAQKAEQNFAIKNVITLITKGIHECEFYQFGSKNDSALEFYFSNMDELKLFTYYFKDKAMKLLKTIKQRGIFLPSINYKHHSDVTSDTYELREYFNKNIKRFHLEGNLYLTKKEVEIVKCCSGGKTADEIALILDISKRTVEKHFENIKQKLNCEKQIQVIETVRKKGIIF